MILMGIGCFLFGNLVGFDGVLVIERGLGGFHGIFFRGQMRLIRPKARVGPGGTW